MCVSVLNFNYIAYFEKDFSFLKFFCLWVEDGTEKSVPYILYYFVINVLVIFLFNISQLINVFVNSDTLMNFAIVGYSIPICTMSTIKSYHIFKNRKIFFDLYTALNKDDFQPFGLDQIRMVRNSLKFHCRIKIILVGVSTVAIFGAMTTPLFYKNNDQGLPFAVWYPFDISLNPRHTVVYIYQCVAVFYISYINVYIEILLAGFATFMALQCDLLCDNLMKINTSNIWQAKKSLKGCVDHHRKIIRFATMTENLFSQIYFGHFFGSTLVFCMTLFLLTLVERDSFGFFYLIMYQMSMFGLLLIPCWFASEATLRSEKIPLAAYECSWPDATQSFKKELIYFMHRTQTPIQLHAIDFFHISVETFVWIFRTSLSYFAVLNNLNNSEE